MAGQLFLILDGSPQKKARWELEGQLQIFMVSQ
jgi:hypothetical protein